MTTRPISHYWQCTGCGRIEEIYRQDMFVHLCCTLLSGKPVEVICSGCGNTDRISFKDGILEQVTSVERWPEAATAEGK